MKSDCYTPDFSTETSKKYQGFRKRILDFIRDVDAPLKHATEICAHPWEAPLADTYQKLEQDNFSLVLIGAFQSGKSTLFNYLCDGRELSPVGPGGGGIRTSGCRVSAHPLQEGAREYAEVSWRSGQDLLRSLGSGLRSFYFDRLDKSKAKTVNYLTTDLVDLNNARQRRELAGHAWELLKKGEAESLELMRFALIVCSFYEDFRKRIRSGNVKMAVDQGVRFSSYPQDWEARWVSQIQAIEDIHSAFRPEEIAFAFCGGVDFYLDSDILRKVGCTINDCPGLFISEWDTEIAKKCIRESDAILYQFGGDKALSESDLNALKACVELGGKNKLLFAANLKIDSNNWQRIETNAILPVLKRNGFDSPVINAIHAGIALRAYEETLYEQGRLSPASRQAIGLELRDFQNKEDTEENVQWFLHKQLKIYIRRITDDEQGLGDYLNEDSSLNAAALEELHKVSELIRRANSFVATNKFESMLIYNGTSAAKTAILKAQANMSSLLDVITGDIESKRQEVENAESELRKLADSKDRACGNINNAIDAQGNKIFKHFCENLDNIYYKNRSKIVDAYEGILPKIGLDVLIKFPEERVEIFKNAFSEICKESLVQFRDSVREEFTKLDEYREIIGQFENERRELVEKFSKLVSFAKIPDIEVRFPSDWIDKAVQNILPTTQDILSALYGGNASWFDQIIAAFKMIFTDHRGAAEKYVAEHDMQFRRVYRDAFAKAFASPGAPLDYLHDKQKEFEEICTEHVKLCNEQVQAAQRALDKANAEEIQRKIGDLNAGIGELEQFVHQLNGIEAEIRQAVKG